MTDTAALPAPSPPSARRSETAATPRDAAPAPVTMDDVVTALDPDEFPGCRAVRMSGEEFDDYDGRVEVWDAATGTAMVCEAAGLYHEEPSHRLAQMTALIAVTRGSPVGVVGSTDLLLRDEHGARRRIMEADQTVYLHPERDRPAGHAIVVGEDAMPDVVVEVDHTTDVRRRKLALYESWKLPEVWVEVPDVRAPSRAANREAGMTIHVLHPDGGYRPAAESRAFPGWTAAEIHRAMNEPVLSAETMAVLERVGRALRDRDGAGPGDAPFPARYARRGPRRRPGGGPRRATGAAVPPGRAPVQRRNRGGAGRVARRRRRSRRLGRRGRLDHRLRHRGRAAGTMFEAARRAPAGVELKPSRRRPVVVSHAPRYGRGPRGASARRGSPQPRQML